MSAWSCARRTRPRSTRRPAGRKTFESAIDKVTVEQSALVRAVIRVEGGTRAGTAPGPRSSCGFHAYAGADSRG